MGHDLRECRLPLKGSTVKVEDTELQSGDKISKAKLHQSINRALEGSTTALALQEHSIDGRKIMMVIAAVEEAGKIMGFDELQ